MPQVKKYISASLFNVAGFCVRKASLKFAGEHEPLGLDFFIWNIQHTFFCNFIEYTIQGKENVAVTLDDIIRRNKRGFQDKAKDLELWQLKEKLKVDGDSHEEILQRYFEKLQIQLPERANSLKEKFKAELFEDKFISREKSRYNLPKTADHWNFRSSRLGIEGRPDFIAYQKKNGAYVAFLLEVKPQYKAEYKGPVWQVGATALAYRDSRKPFSNVQLSDTHIIYSYKDGEFSKVCPDENKILDIAKKIRARVPAKDYFSEKKCARCFFYSKCKAEYSLASSL